MKQYFVLLIAIITTLLSINPAFAAGVRITNKTAHVVAVTIKSIGLVFAADIPRIAFLSPKESFLFDAGFGGIEAITTSICDKILLFDFTLAGTTGVRNCVLTQAGTDFLLDVGSTGLLPPLGQFKGKIIKKSKRHCLCLTPVKPNPTNK